MELDNKLWLALIPALILLIYMISNIIRTIRSSEATHCEHLNCTSPITYKVYTHGFGLVRFPHYYCDEHYKLHIDSYKHDPKEDVIKVIENGGVI